MHPYVCRLRMVLHLDRSEPDGALDEPSSYQVQVAL